MNGHEDSSQNGCTRKWLNLTFYIYQVEEAKRRSEQEAREAEEKEKARQVGDQKAIKTVETKPK